LITFPIILHSFSHDLLMSLLATSEIFKTAKLVFSIKMERCGALTQG